MGHVPSTEVKHGSEGSDITERLVQFHPHCHITYDFLAFMCGIARFNYDRQALANLELGMLMVCCTVYMPT